MKLALRSERGVEILIGSESISSNDVRVLKAGISKIFRAGKNRIVLDLPESDSIPFDVLRELTELDLLARELSGRLVLSGLKSTARAQVSSFANPPPIECFASVEEAIQHFIKPGPGKAAGGVEPAGAAPTTSVTPESKQQHRSAELGELGTLRREVAQLKDENEVLRKHLQFLLIERRRPKDEDSYRRTIENLQEQIEALIAPESVESPESAEGKKKA